MILEGLTSFLIKDCTQILLLLSFYTIDNFLPIYDGNILSRKYFCLRSLGSMLAGESVKGLGAADLVWLILCIFLS